MAGTDAARAETRAGTIVANIADAQYRIGDTSPSVRSNSATLRIAERLDLTLATAGAAQISGEVSIIPVRLHNSGNGSEAFDILATVPAGTVRGVSIDRDGDGRYDPAVDTPLDGGRTAPLDPDAAMTLFILVDTTATGPVAVRATAVTGSGAPGTVFAGQGDGGGDAVVGATGATATLSFPIGAAAAPTLSKTQSVVAPDGSANPVTGAVVTYTIAAAFAGPADAATLDDPIPAGSRYVAGSLRLDDAPLSDADDADPGRVADGNVHVALGRIDAAATHRIRFQVQLQ